MVRSGGRSSWYKTERGLPHYCFPLPLPLLLLLLLRLRFHLRMKKRWRKDGPSEAGRLVPPAAVAAAVAVAVAVAVAAAAAAVVTGCRCGGRLLVGGFVSFACTRRGAT